MFCVQFVGQDGVPVFLAQDFRDGPESVTPSPVNLWTTTDRGEAEDLAEQLRPDCEERGLRVGAISLSYALSWVRVWLTINGRKPTDEERAALTGQLSRNREYRSAMLRAKKGNVKRTKGPRK